MTRFARIQRNKSSFARIPEEATSWAEFKGQMNKKREDQEEIDSVSRFPEEHSNSEVSKHIESNWCDFDQSSDGKHGCLLKNEKKCKHMFALENTEVSTSVKKKKKHRQDTDDREREGFANEVAEVGSRIRKKNEQYVGEEEKDDYVEVTSSVKKNKKHHIKNSFVDSMRLDISEETEYSSSVGKKKMKHKQDATDKGRQNDGEYSGGNKKKQKKDAGNNSRQDVSEDAESGSSGYRMKSRHKLDAVYGTSHDLDDVTDEARLNCTLKKKKKCRKSAIENSSQDDVCDNTEDVNLVKNKHNQRSFDNGGQDDVDNDAEINYVKKNKKKYKQSIVDDGGQFVGKDSDTLVKKKHNQANFDDNGVRKGDAENYSRPSVNENPIVEYSRKKKRKIEGNTKYFVNGEYVETTKFDGYYILDHDAERIQKLRQELLRKGRSPEVIEGIIRRERRNAEKRLSKKKKKLCFHCREGVHNLSECPKLGGTGGRPINGNVCYKCGSTEHSLHQCKVPGSELKFAKCFICNESGHLSKQCPDNPRGLYPHGGSCRMCGDVTHLKRDCPELIKRKKDNSITVGTLRDGIDCLDEDEKPKFEPFTGTKRVNKIIKF